MRSVFVALCVLAMVGGYAKADSDSEKKPEQGGASHPAQQNPIIIHHRPRVLEGQLTIGDSHFDYVSGGRGWSIPYGDWEITPETVGSWGSRHGAIGLNNDTIHDPRSGTDRDGIEIHATDHRATAGCVGILEHFNLLKELIAKLIERAGQAYLHIGPTGAAITGERLSPLPPFEYVPEKVESDTHVAEDESPKHRGHRRTKLARHHGREHIAHSYHRHYAHHYPLHYALEH